MVAGFQQEAEGACNAVTGLTTNNITNISAKLNWTAVACDSFLVRYVNTADPNTVFYKTVSSGAATSVTISGLYPNTTYSWLIHTYCSGGQSGAYQSTAATFTTLNTAAFCLVPNFTSTSSVTANSASLNWNTLEIGRAHV